MSKYDILFSEKEKENIIKDYVENLLSIKEICFKYSIKNKQWLCKKLLKGKTRSYNESCKIAHKKYPEKFLHTEETKKLMRQKRLDFMKNHPEETAWRKRNKPSYPEQCFIDFLNEYGYSDKYLIEREKSIFPYFIDFAFNDLKIAVEIDGSQHYLEEDRIKRDKKKDELLISLGWSILRISAISLVNKEFKEIDKKLSEIIVSVKTVVQPLQVGLIKKIKGKKRLSKNGKWYVNYREKSEKYSDNQTIKQYENSLRQRKVKDRPSKEELFEMMSTQTFKSIAEKYGVSTNAIQKWCKAYGIPHRKRDYNNLG